MHLRMRGSPRPAAAEPPRRSPPPGPRKPGEGNWGFTATIAAGRSLVSRRTTTASMGRRDRQSRGDRGPDAFSKLIGRLGRVQHGEARGLRPGELEVALAHPAVERLGLQVEPVA